MSAAECAPLRCPFLCCSSSPSPALPHSPALTCPCHRLPLAVQLPRCAATPLPPVTPLFPPLASHAPPLACNSLHSAGQCSRAASEVGIEAASAAPPPLLAPVPRRSPHTPPAPAGAPRCSRSTAMFLLPCGPTCLASVAASCACGAASTACAAALRSSARLAWSLLFTASLLAAWVARDFGAALLKRLPCARLRGGLRGEGLVPATRGAAGRRAGAGVGAAAGTAACCSAAARRLPLRTRRSPPFPGLLRLPQGWCATSMAASCRRMRGLASRPSTASPSATL